MADGEVLTRFRVGGMDCPACATKIDTAVRRLPGVADVSVSSTAGTMAVRGAADLARVTATVEALGYTLQPADAAARDAEPDGAESAPEPQAWWRQRKPLALAVCAGAFALAWALSRLAPGLGVWPFVAAVAAGLPPIAWRAVRAALAGSPFSIEMLMTIAAAGAVAIGSAEEAAVVIALFQVGELLEGVAAGRARRSIEALAALAPRTALLETADGAVETLAERLQVADVIVVRPGERIAADGEILSGAGGVDESPVTGESVPVDKAPGDAVFAGAVNGEAALRVRVNAAAKDNTIARVVRLVEEAQESKAPAERFIERFSRGYTPLVVGAAALAAVVPPLAFHQPWSVWLYRGLALLLIGCPCALVISTPAAIAASLSAGARRGLLIKGGAVLERLRAITVVAFDKTGTLTTGKPQVTDVVPLAGGSEAEALRWAAALEQHSTHPLALAILGRAKAAGVAAPAALGVITLPGQGVTGSVDGRQVWLKSAKAAALEGEVAARAAALADAGKTVCVLALDGAPQALVGLRDTLRPDAVVGLQALKALGVRGQMLTGDHVRTAEAIGAALGIPVCADLLPRQKRAIVAELQAAGEVVAKVGDGVNDAPALAAADVGIAMGGGTDVALETADAAILHGRLGDVARMIALSRRTMANIAQNVTIALGLKAVFLATTLTGITGLWPAILADTGATVLVTANALRLLRPARDVDGEHGGSGRNIDTRGDI